ncbi:MAG: hypothetical protein WKF75_06030, partial [Singulisphaera sp.]
MLAAGLMTAGVLAVSGCSDDGLPTRYPVSGTVTYKGKPLNGGQISFIPESADGRAASGDIKEGAYSLTTQSKDDGALPGKYHVTLIAMEVDLTKAIAKQQGGIPQQGDVILANKMAKRQIPSKYAIP